MSPCLGKLLQVGTVQGELVEESAPHTVAV
jgi:hypothetical protein